MNRRYKDDERQAKYEEYLKIVAKQRKLKDDGDRIVKELNESGITSKSDLNKIEGLGDLVHAALNKVGITEERFKKVLNLQECKCTERRRLLNKLVPFIRNN
jgi:predicted flap endonuclease-1-like 5' DNA nuclease